MQSDAEASDGSDVSEKLRKSIEHSINSYNIEKASSGSESKPASVKAASTSQGKPQEKASAKKDEDEISSFSDDDL